MTANIVSKEMLWEKNGQKKIKAIRVAEQIQEVSTRHIQPAFWRSQQGFSKLLL